ncbi:hypothetical protein FORC13_p066 (plasmid) [Bacillus cereus]|uniref:hypothetical protein n=1 Tax=Bacillus cereus group TaxID=86661 RepID=UPI000744C73E|nr:MULTISPECIES: hypothetical protein [Bacillus cereus group]ALZ64551.1 hypothetical protein FORC13_p066 [Bacillus cereus]MEC2394901.1 hypothetical protein [Bacillus toyonensis]OTX40211.1 hypothetical protein BK717_05575 [Bacillus thuringiensis serovar malayensis]OUB09049.1 hypothetical protein BK709_07340 [Bacillus thuringiensis serovar shandongiensis]
MNKPFKQIRKQLFQPLFTLFRFLIGMGWLWAGIIKITEKSWFNESDIIVQNYVILALKSPDFLEFYNSFIRNIALEYSIFLKDAIPMIQIMFGISIIVGFMILPSILICLFIHISFILSGNMDLINLVLYASTLGILFFLKRSYVWSLDHFFKTKSYFHLNKLKD